MPENLDAKITTSRDMPYCISANQNFRVKKKKKNLTPDHKIFEKRMLTNFFFTWPYWVNIARNKGKNLIKYLNECLFVFQQL